MNRARLRRRLRVLEQQRGETREERLRAACDLLTSDEKRKRVAELIAIGEARVRARIEAGESREAIAAAGLAEDDARPLPESVVTMLRELSALVEADD